MAYDRSIIYGLCDPLTGELRYIGKANNPESRLRQHLRERRRVTPLYCWLKKLAGEGQTPKLIEIERPKDWRKAEQFWIAHHRLHGTKLLNLADGGDEPSITLEQRQNAARAATKARVSGPNAELNRLLQLMGVEGAYAIKNGRRTVGEIRSVWFRIAYKMKFWIKCVRSAL